MRQFQVICGLRSSFPAELLSEIKDPFLQRLGQRRFGTILTVPDHDTKMD